MSPPMSCLVSSRSASSAAPPPGHRRRRRSCPWRPGTGWDRRPGPAWRTGFSTNAAILFRRGRPGVATSITPNWLAMCSGWRTAATVALAPLAMWLRTICGEVHPVHVVRSDHDDDVRLGVMDQVQRLVDGIGAAQEPALAHALLGRNGGHVIAQLGGHPPGLGNVPVQAVRLVLGQHHDLQIAGIGQVREGKIDQPVTAGKRYGGFGPVCRQRHQPVSLTAREDNCQNFLVPVWPSPYPLDNCYRDNSPESPRWSSH